MLGLGTGVPGFVRFTKRISNYDSALTRFVGLSGFGLRVLGFEVVSSAPEDNKTLIYIPDIPSNPSKFDAFP